MCLVLSVVWLFVLFAVVCELCFVLFGLVVALLGWCALVCSVLS